MLRHVQFAILLQFAEHDKADLAGTAAVVPGADRRDFRLALENPLDEGSLESPTRQELSLEALARGGWLTLTELGRLRVDHDDI